MRIGDNLGSRWRAWLALALAVTAWLWHGHGSDDAGSRATTATTRATFANLLAQVPTPAQVKFRPRYILGGELRIEGQTIDIEQRPIGGVKVTLDGKRVAITEADGSFAFDHLAEATYVVTAEKDALYAEDTINLWAESDPMELEMKTGPALHVHVETVDHTPIRDAHLDVGRREALTDADGNAFVRGLDIGGERLDIAADGFGPQRIDLDTGDDPRATLTKVIVLTPGAPFGGTVVDQDGALVPGATVTLNEGDWRDHVEADDHGHWMVEFVGTGKVVASATSDAHLAEPEVVIAHDGTHAQRDVVIHVTLGARARGIVVDAAGAPVAKASVSVGTGYATTDERGHFEIVGITPGLVEVTANTERMAAVTRKVQVDRGPALELRIAMVDSSIAGIVRGPHGEPVEEASISAHGKDDVGSGYARSDEHGRFDLGGLPPGDYELTVERDQEKSSGTINATVRTGNRNVVLVAPELGGIAGRVILDGAPVDYYGVVVSSDPDPSWAQSPDVVRSPDGVFTQKGFRPGTYAVSIVGPAFTRKLIQNVQIADGITELGDLRVERGRVVRGRVHDEGGQPIAGALVSVATRDAFLDDDSLGGKAAGTHTARTDALGRFEIAGIESAGDERLWVGAVLDHAMATPREVEAATSEVELTIARAGRLDGQVTSARDRYPRIYLTSVPEGADFSTTADRAGEFHFERLPPGDYVLELHGGIAMVPMHVHIAADTSTVISIDLPAQPLQLAVQAADCEHVTLKAGEHMVAFQRCHSGIAEFPDVAPGTYRACVRWDQCGEINVLPSPSRQQVALQIQPEPEPEPESSPAPLDPPASEPAPVDEPATPADP